MFSIFKDILYVKDKTESLMLLTDTTKPLNKAVRVGLREEMDAQAWEEVLLHVHFQITPSTASICQCTELACGIMMNLEIMTL